MSEPLAVPTSDPTQARSGRVGGTWTIPSIFSCCLAWAGLVSVLHPLTASRFLFAWLCATLLLTITHVISLELLTWETRFQRALILAITLSSVASSALMFLTKAFTHHRPLGAVTVAATSVLLCAGFTIIGSQLRLIPMPPRALTFLPYVLLLLGAGVAPSDVRLSGLLAWAIGVGLRLSTRALNRHKIPRWIDWVLLTGLTLGTWVASS